MTCSHCGTDIPPGYQWWPRPNFLNWENGLVLCAACAELQVRPWLRMERWLEEFTTEAHLDRLKEIAGDS